MRTLRNGNQTITVVQKDDAGAAMTTLVTINKANNRTEVSVNGDSITKYHGNLTNGIVYCDGNIGNQNGCDGSIGDSSAARIEVDAAVVAYGTYDACAYSSRTFGYMLNMGSYVVADLGIFSTPSPGIPCSRLYDNRLSSAPPPFFPTTGNQYDVLSWKRVSTPWTASSPRKEQRHSARP